MPLRSCGEKRLDTVNEIRECCDETRNRREETNQEYETHKDRTQPNSDGGCSSAGCGDSAKSLDDPVKGDYEPENNKPYSRPSLWKGGKEFLQNMPPRAQWSAPPLRIACFI